ncbi:hypothetical protein CAMSH0001_1455 [Campylobacter showae RM3277]|uniref:Uncharacterized protein n=1 Tax=Campylobacter showae RM3277 TaxID=553219 RepID=C6RIV7_9BACT|nr:hypothetical protein CAMSH0001_1455 [Campylobacter showae RM3277]
MVKVEFKQSKTARHKISSHSRAVKFEVLNLKSSSKPIQS